VLAGAGQTSRRGHAVTIQITDTAEAHALALTAQLSAD
jgi:hypothetical protein